MTTYNVNGVSIETSHMGRSGYLGCTFCPTWTRDYEHPFIAMAQNPTDDPILERWLTAKKRTSLHLARYDDSREAAYVTALYKQNPEQVLKEIYFGTFAPEFPKELYDLPVYLGTDEAQKIVKRYKKSRNKPKIDYSNILKVARDCASNKEVDLKMATKIRNQLDIAYKNKRYTTMEEVEMHVNELIKEYK